VAHSQVVAISPSSSQAPLMMVFGVAALASTRCGRPVSRSPMLKDTQALGFLSFLTRHGMLAA
jgi:hypothetical protein